MKSADNSEKKIFFTNQDLKRLILPLFCEQFLTILVGLADTFIISFVGEAAVSGVSLVNAFNTIFIYLFTALASGGAVIVSQYIGKAHAQNTNVKHLNCKSANTQNSNIGSTNTKNTNVKNSNSGNLSIKNENTQDSNAGNSESDFWIDKAGKSASQLLMISALFSLVLAAVSLIFNRSLMQLLFGQVEADVMDACVTYLRISAYSYPAIAVYNAGAALCRSLGKTSTTMYISIIANIINVIGNLIGVFVLKAGVAGVAWPSLLARAFSATLITILCFQAKNEVRYRARWIFAWNSDLLKRMLGIAVPNGIEQGIFQFVKVALSSVIALFGTYQIAANGIAQSIWSLAALAGVTMGPVFITVIGQTMGARDTKAAEFYFKKLLKISLVLSIAWNALIFVLTPFVLHFYAIADETKQLVLWLVLIHNIFNSIAFPFADSLGKGLRAAGDVQFTTAISITTTVGVRLIFSMLFAILLGWGVIGIALAMCMDWCSRAVVFIIRFRGGRWKKFQLI